MGAGIAACVPDVSKIEDARVEEGDCFHADVHFDQHWCMAYLKLSGDKNIPLHSYTGKRVVQGMAVMTKMGTFVSEKIPNYMVVEIGTAIKFREPLYMDDIVTMAIKITQVGRVRITAEFTLYKNEDILMQTPLSLVHMKILDRMK